MPFVNNYHLFKIILGKQYQESVVILDKILIGKRDCIMLFLET